MPNAMTFDALCHALTRAVPDVPPGPVALLFDEDRVALTETLDHLLARGFAKVVLVSAAPPALTEAQSERTLVLEADRVQSDLVFALINHAIAAMPGRWLHYCYNAEFLHYPFCETRSIGELVAFHMEERREAMMTYVIDLYAGDLEAAPNGVDLAAPCLDRSGYYALDRLNAHGTRLDRQWDYFGGLRWRYEEHIPEARRRIDRIGLFRAQAGLEILDGHVTNMPELNTVACEWHHSLTAAIASFRVAKALKANPGSRDAIPTFRWHNSVEFDWSSKQLMDLGLMEPGQWF